MSHSPDPASPSVYEAIGFDARLEARALERLGALDLDGCRSHLGRLVSGLRLDDRTLAGGRHRVVTGLLLDLLQRVNRRVHDGPPTHPTVQHRRLALIECFAACESAAAAREAFMPQLNQLLALLGRGSRSRHAIVERARRYIDAHYTDRVFLSAVATKLNVSPNYLSRLFREQVGVTLTHYVQQKRVERARIMLAAGNGTISEIAYRVGYQNYRDFYRNFVKLEGASPRAVRRRLVKGDAGAASLAL